MHIIFLYADQANEWNCSQWRSLTPSDAINAEHEAGRTSLTAQCFQLPSAIDWHNPLVQRALGLGDVLIFQRNVIIPEIWEAMDYWRALGKVVAIDLDDHYPGLIPSISAFDYWIRNAANLPQHPIDALEEGMRHADALISPSKVILEDWAHVVPGYWVPNWPRGKWYAELDQRPIGAPYDLIVESQAKGDAIVRERLNSAGWIVLGWGGSLSHVDSWLESGIIPALDNIFTDYPQARLKFCGHEDRLDDLVFKRWGDRVIKQDGVKPEDWPLVISTFDIGLAPLDTRPIDPPWRPGGPVAAYDERRSWLKAAEYLCAGVPYAASKSRTYEDLNGRGHMAINGAANWTATLRGMMRDLASEKREARHMRRWALQKLTFDGNVNRYGDIMGRLQAVKITSKKVHLPGITYVQAVKERNESH